MENRIFNKQKEDIFHRNRTSIYKLNKRLETVDYDEKIRIVNQYLEYIRSFTSKGVQGIVGLVKPIDDTNEPMVFKTSVDMNKTVEHEFLILEDLNSIRTYCPHFVRSIGMINIPVSIEFIFDSYKNKLFDETNDETIPRSIMFLECVNKLPFYKLCDHSKNKNIVSSQLLQIMMALEISQLKKKFTHYDLHTSNILVQMCEKDSVFLYKLNNNYYFVPTYGFFPMIIDTGISYSNKTDHNFMMSNTDNYQNGFQTTVYDSLNDVHHFLLTTFYYIETDLECFDHMCNKIKRIFRHLPVLRKSGWKELPNYLSKRVIEKIRNECKLYKKYDLFYNYERESLEILNGLIRLPIKFNGKDSLSFSPSFQSFVEEYNKIMEMENFTDHDILFVLSTFVDLVNKYRDDYMNSVDRNTRVEYMKRFRQDFVEKVGSVLKNNIHYDDIDYEKMFVSSIVFSEVLETNYHVLIEDNKKIITKSYEKTCVESPIDMFLYIQKNLTPHYEMKQDTVVYLWDIDNETKRVKSCNTMSNQDLKKINNVSITTKGKMLYEKLFQK